MASEVSYHDEDYFKAEVTFVSEHAWLEELSSFQKEHMGRISISPLSWRSKEEEYWWNKVGLYFLGTKMS